MIQYCFLKKTEAILIKFFLIKMLWLKNKDKVEDNKRFCK